MNPEGLNVCFQDIEIGRRSRATYYANVGPFDVPPNPRRIGVRWWVNTESAENIGQLFDRAGGRMLDAMTGPYQGMRWLPIHEIGADLLGPLHVSDPGGVGSFLVDVWIESDNLKDAYSGSNR